MRTISYVLLLFSFGMTACQENPSNEFQISSAPAYENGCEWITSELAVFNSVDQFVSFKHEVCAEPVHEHLFVERDGNKITKLTFDIVSASFSIFQQENYSEKEFVENLIDKHWEHEGSCTAKKIGKNTWKVDDGKPQKAEINFMPCGKYGRNFAGEMIFTFDNKIIFHVPISGENRSIDFDSIKYIQKS